MDGVHGERFVYALASPSSATSSSVREGAARGRQRDFSAPSSACVRSKTTPKPSAHQDAPVRPKLFDVEAKLRFLGLLIVGSHERAIVYRKDAFQVPGHLPNAHQAHVGRRASPPPLYPFIWPLCGCGLGSRLIRIRPVFARNQPGVVLRQQLKVV